MDSWLADRVSIADAIHAVSGCFHLQAGVSRFDASVGGLGGCPFVNQAAGNISTEDLAFLCSELDIETGLNLELYIEAAKYAEEITGQKLPGKLKDGGLPAIG